MSAFLTAITFIAWSMVVLTISHRGANIAPDKSNERRLTIPADGFLLSISGLGVSLAGFSGLVAAFRRGAQWKPLDSYRLRQIPEMGLATEAFSQSRSARR